MMNDWEHIAMTNIDMMNQGNNTSMIGPRGPRLAGLAIPLGSIPPQGLKSNRGLWNMAGEEVYEVPTNNALEIFGKARNQRVDNMLGSSMNERDLSYGNYNPENAERDGLGFFDRRKVSGAMDDVSDITYNPSAKLSKGTGGVTYSTGSINPFSDRTSPFAIDINRNSSNMKGAETANHEFKHLVDETMGESTHSNSDPYYWKRGSEALGRISGNRTHYPDELTSSTSKYGIHPLLEFNPIDDAFSMMNANTLLRDKYRNGQITKEDGRKILGQLEAEVRRLNKLMQDDQVFASKVYAASPEKFQTDMRDKKRYKRDAKRRLKAETFSGEKEPFYK